MAVDLLSSRPRTVGETFIEAGLEVAKGGGDTAERKADGPLCPPGRGAGGQVPKRVFVGGGPSLRESRPRKEMRKGEPAEEEEEEESSPQQQGRGAWERESRSRLLPHNPVSPAMESALADVDVVVGHLAAAFLEANDLRRVQGSRVQATCRRLGGTMGAHDANDEDTQTALSGGRRAIPAAGRPRPEQGGAGADGGVGRRPPRATDRTP
ncbi:hypothetical protein THAOC_09288 [Thalassiosira oceanica]|uniref:Uncharacterized protein n=1 Tax=Thalassiosira oceanica TaxID=159749 RepID=K0SVH8_THAOC|nr:hypothetical protein THAOC_09288 [Thalassiosira oceanica]|eukprot:EJK69455.1 hypothetical protein THAOC_09288 [Thalassiosira oceanica]